MGDTIRSMTGFGSGVREVNGFHITAEISSVNHRYLRVSSHLPEELAWAQRRVEARVRDAFVRGSLNVVLNLESSRPADFDIDAEFLKRLYRRVDEVRAEIVPDEEIRLRDLLMLEGVVQLHGSTEVRAEEVLPVLEQVVDEAVKGLREMQQREGSHLHDELQELLGELDRGLEAVSELLPGVAQGNRERYLARIREFLSGTGVEVESSDLLREVAVLAEKADITEELGRLRGHLEQFRETLTEGNRVGRKLDFLTQEMFREANTMAAKANHHAVARQVVEMKAGIDRLREQTQNIE